MTVVRASALTGWPDCERRGAARLFGAEIAAAGFTLRQTSNNIGATMGTAVHSGAAYTLRQKVENGNLAPLDAVTDCAIESYREQVAEGVMFDRETPASNAAEKQIIGMVGAYQRSIAPDIEPVIVEERLEADTGFGLILSGQSDVLAREPGRLRDLKTGKRAGLHTPQLGAYSLLSRAHGLDVQEVCIDFIQRVPLTKPQPDPVTTHYDIAAAESAAVAVLRHIANGIETFREGQPERGILAGDPWAFTANPNSMLCGDKWCPAWGTSFCTEHKKEITHE